MVSLTPQENKAEVAGSAVREGAINGIMALIPSYGLFLLAMKNSPKFVKVSQAVHACEHAIMRYAGEVRNDHVTMKFSLDCLRSHPKPHIDVSSVHELAKSHVSRSLASMLHICFYLRARP